MMALQAIYDGGRIFFPFNFPDNEGPLQVLVIFPSGVEKPKPEGLPRGCSGQCLCGGMPEYPYNQTVAEFYPVR